MKILVACEESQAVCKELRRLGHEAYSCDIQDCSGGFPEWHTKTDVTDLLNGNCEFETCDGKKHVIDGRWDMIIAFPPCTHLACSGARHFEKKRADGRQRRAIEFFCRVLTADCEKISVENPVNIISGNYVRKWFPDLSNKYNLPIKPTQEIQPYMFGDAYEKKTCLWLKGLHPLHSTNVVTPPSRTVFKSGKTMATWFANSFCLPSEERSRVRSKTFAGIARAMAEQWAGDNVRPAYIQQCLF